MQIDNTLALNSYSDISANKIKNANAKQDALLKEQTDAFEAFFKERLLSKFIFCRCSDINILF